LYNQQEYRQAEPLCEEALRIERGLPNPSAIIMATSLNNLAEIAKQRQEDDRAESFYREALAIHKQNSDKRTLRAAVQTYNNLAMLYKGGGRFLLAHQVTDEAQKLQQTVAPSDVVAAASILNTRASISRTHFDNHAAAQSYLDAIALLGTTHEEPLCDTLDNYADLLLDQREQEKAEIYYLQAIDHCTNARGAEHPCVAERMVDLGVLYRRLGKFDMAEKNLRQALAINTKSFDFESPIVINTINDLSAVYVDQKKFAEAGDLYAKWVPELTRELGASHPHVADALENWALVASKANNHKQAEELRERAKSIRSALIRPSQPAGPVRPSSELTLDTQKRAE
jgi:tetratricopeptide (TPR) repeat protein